MKREFAAVAGLIALTYGFIFALFVGIILGALKIAGVI